MKTIVVDGLGDANPCPVRQVDPCASTPGNLRRDSLERHLVVEMTKPPPLYEGLSQLTDHYDALICDVWGVVHDGLRAYRESCDALARFRNEVGPVVLLSNAPRVLRDVKVQFERLGVPEACYDTIITSGMAARDDLARRTATGTVALFHLGPERDRGVFEGLTVALTNLQSASVVLCTGLFNDDVETPDDYQTMLGEMRTRNLSMLCANPDYLVQRGEKLVYCAGALAKAYEQIGGHAIYYGKPYRPIYDLALSAVGAATRPLAIGDGLNTDVKGANAAHIDALFIVSGVHAKECEPPTSARLQSVFERAGVSVIGSMRTLVW